MNLFSLEILRLTTWIGNDKLENFRQMRKSRVFPLSYLPYVASFVLILGLNPGAVPRMGPRPVAPALFGSCLIYLCYLFIWSTQ